MPTRRKVTFSCQKPQETNEDGVAAPYTILSNNPVQFDENGEVRYCLVNSTPDMSDVEHKEMLRLVFDEINHQIWPLRIVAADDPEDAYFKIHFVKEDGKVYDNDDKYLFDCPYKFKTSTLAVQYANYGGRWAGHCFINDVFYFKLFDTKNQKDIVNILIHEVGGHGMGLGHTMEENDILQPFYNHKNYWTKDSTRGIVSLYTPQMRASVQSDERQSIILDALRGAEYQDQPKAVKATAKKPIKKSAARRRKGVISRF